jgi:DtxR family Mn-dependent transcriptional regulator
MKDQVWKTFAAQEVSHSMAHYLTAIHNLLARRGYARVSDVARELEVTKGSASVQLKHLKEKGLVTEDDNRFLQLTDAGETVANEVMYNRQVIIQFLHTILGLEGRQAETDACMVEHLLSQEATHQLLALVQLLQSDEPVAKRFLERFRNFKIRCPSPENCRICQDVCLVENVPTASPRRSAGGEKRGGKRTKRPDRE